MTAVLDKPRAKTGKRTAAAPKIETPLVTIADIRAWISSAEQKLEMAYDAADRGEPIDTLLDHINHDAINEPLRIIQRDDLTQADAQRVYSGLFPVLACIEGALKLAESTVLHPTLKEVMTLLDAAQTALDPVNDAIRALPAGGSEHDFERGKNLAMEMLRQCHDAGDQQSSIVSEHLVEMMCEQSLFDGFTSMLSEAIGAQVVADTHADEQTASRASPRPVHRAAHLDEPHDPYVVILHALACVEAASVNGGTDVLCALHSLTEKASEKVSEANGQLQAGSYSQELHDAASDELAGLLGLLRVLDDGTEPMLSAAETLVILCKAGIDRAIHKQPKAGLHT